MRNKFISLCLALLLVLTIPLTAFAQDFVYDKKGSITVSMIDNSTNAPVAGAQFALYCIADVNLSSNGNLNYAYTSEFEHCGFNLDDTSLTSKLKEYTDINSVTEIVAVTDIHGEAVFQNLAVGLYFVKQTNYVQGYSPCSPFIVTVPYKDGDNYIYNVDASPKTDIEKLTDITIKKVWNTDKSAQATDSVKVHLLKDGAVVQTATLSILNDWKVTYTDMPQSDGYSVVEINVPKGFTATYSRDGYDFTVINSASLIDTGKLVWPVPIFAMMGVSLITIGTVILKKAEEYDE